MNATLLLVDRGQNSQTVRASTSTGVEKEKVGSSSQVESAFLWVLHRLFHTGQGQVST